VGGRLGDVVTGPGTLSAITVDMVRAFAGECRVLGAGEAVERSFGNALGVDISTECMRTRPARDGGGVVQRTASLDGDKFSSSASSASPESSCSWGIAIGLKFCFSFLLEGDEDSVFLGGDPEAAGCFLRTREVRGGWMEASSCVSAAERLRTELLCLRSFWGELPIRVDERDGAASSDSFRRALALVARFGGEGSAASVSSCALRFGICEGIWLKESRYDVWTLDASVTSY
jgi:hypothetical protein